MISLFEQNKYRSLYGIYDGFGNFLMKIDRDLGRLQVLKMNNSQ